MLNALSPSAQRFVSDLKRLDAQTGKAQRQISSGVRIERPSDDPSQVPDLLHVRARLDEAVQAHANLERAKAQIDAGERGVDSAVNLLDRAVQIATQAAGSSATPEQKQALAIETGSLIERMQALAGIAVAGVDVFGSEPAAITDADGSRFQISRTAGEIFEQPLAALKALQGALLSGGVDGVLPVLKTCQTRMSGHLAFYGVVQSRVREALDTASKRQTETKAHLAAIRETDVVSAATELTQARTHLDAALASQAGQPRSSLFDYLG